MNAFRSRKTDMTTLLVPSICISLALSAACTATDTDEGPRFIDSLISHYESLPADEAPNSIWRVIYEGETRYFVDDMPCCDVMTILYELDGEVVCYPHGGIAGIGDGRCTDFDPGNAQNTLVWIDSRTGNHPE